MDFVYTAEFFTNDGETALRDMDTEGWYSPEMAADTVRFSLVPKPGYVTMKGNPYPLVTVNIPEGSILIYRSRVFVKEEYVEGVQLVNFRVYCAGYEDPGGTRHWTWVMPTGDVELGTGEDSYLADILFTHLVKVGRGEAT
jgi:hypothetical protein